MRLSLKRVVPGSVPPWRACSAWARGGFGLPGVVFFRAPVVGQKRGSDGLARLKPCCDAADFRQAPRQEKQARSRQAIEVASEAHLRARARCLTSRTFSGLFFLQAQDPCLRLLLVRRSPSNAACQLLRWSPLAVAPVSRHFAAAPAAHVFAPGLFSCAAACGSWRLEAGPGWVGLRSKLLMSFA